MIGYWNYTIILTYCSLISAAFGIGFAVSDRPEYAIICLLLSGFFDLFDGKVARTKKNRTEREKRFGVQIDSLCDMVAFGVLPAFIGYSTVIGLRSWWEVVFLSFYVLCGLIRLAFFNSLEEEKNQARAFMATASEEEKAAHPEMAELTKPGFVGVPITAAALVFPFVFCFKEVFEKMGNGDVFKYFYMAFLIIMGFLFIDKIKIPKPGLKGTIALIAIGCVLLTFLILVFTGVLF